MRRELKAGARNEYALPRGSMGMRRKIPGFVEQHSTQATGFDVTRTRGMHSHAGAWA